MLEVKHENYIAIRENASTCRRNMAKDACSGCNEALFIEVDLDSDVEDSKAPAKPETIPDDVELSCGCHYHWYVLHCRET